MAIDLGSIAQNVVSNQGLVGLGANLLLITPNSNIGIEPKSAANQSFLEGIFSSKKSIFFDIIGEETTTLTSDSTDHYIEDNSAVQDHVAIKPVMITVTGYISELNNVVPDFLNPLKFAADKLTVISPFVPALSAQALIAYNQAAQVYATIEIAARAALSIWDSTLGDGVQNKQQVIFTQLFNYFQAKQLFSVQTPWAVHQNMIIQSLRSVQTEDTRMITEYEITFKQLRFLDNAVPSDEAQAAGRLDSQNSTEVPYGSSTGSPSLESFSDKTQALA